MNARIVFDLDGTLIDSAPDLHGIANALLQERDAPPVSLAEVRDFIGNGAPVFVQRMRAARGIPDSEQDRLLADFKRRYLTAFGLTKLYPGVRAALDQLEAQGHRLGICTNKPIAPCHAVLEHLDLARYFAVVIGGDSQPVHKPDAAPLNAAFDGLGQGPRLYVGDSGVDAETAQNASAPFLLFTEGYRKEPVSALPHTRAFDDWDGLPGLVAAVLETSGA